MHGMVVCCARGGLMQHYTLQTERKIIQGRFPSSGRLSEYGTEGEGSMFAVLEASNSYTEGIFGIVIFF